MKSFVKNIQSQNSFLSLDNKDKIFNYLQKIIKNNLLEYIKANQGKFLNEMKFNFNNNYSKQSNKFLDNDKIENIIENKSQEPFFKNLVQNSLNEIPKSNDKQSKKLNQLTLILTGKSGVGKSTLIKVLFRG